MAIIATNLLAQADQIERAERKYGVSSVSNYEQLLVAMSKAYADLKANSQDPTAAFAMNQIYNYVKPSNKIQFNYEFFLQQPDLISKEAALNGINKYLESGLAVDSLLSKPIADKICLDQKLFSTGDRKSKAFLRTSIRTLLYLHDDRGLEAVLADKEYIRRLQVVDDWDSDSNAGTFDRVSHKYSLLVGQQEGAKERSAIYELCRKRKTAGAQRIESSRSVINSGSVN